MSGRLSNVKVGFDTETCVFLRDCQWDLSFHGRVEIDSVKL